MENLPLYKEGEYYFVGNKKNSNEKFKRGWSSMSLKGSPMTHLGWVASTASNQETDTRNSHQVKRRLPEETNLAYQVDN